MLTMKKYQQIDDAPDRAAKIAAMRLHVSIALIAYLFFAFRIGWAIKRPEIEAPPQHSVLQGVARWAPRLLLIAIVIQMISGPLTIWSGGRAIAFFDLFSIPSPMQRHEDLHHLLKEIHEITAKSIFVLFVIHVLGVLKHLLINKDRVLVRMLKPGATLEKGDDEEYHA